MSEEMKNNAPQANEETYSLNDDRRVKTLSPGALTAKRFFRNRLAVVGLVILAAMFLFSFVGGWLNPYEQDQVFYRDDIQMKEYRKIYNYMGFVHIQYCRLILSMILAAMK